MIFRRVLPILPSLALLALLASSPLSSGAGAPIRLYRNDAMRVHAFEPPPSWVPAPQASYPRLLVSYSHAEGGRITLTAQKVAPGITAQQLAVASHVALENQGFANIQLKSDARDPTRVRLAAQLDGGKRFVLQLYLVDSNIGYVVTLAAPRVHEPTMTRDFEAAVRSLQLGGSESAHLDADGGVPR